MESRAPTFANLLVSITNLIWYLKDSFGILENISATPPWVQSLWDEIHSLRLLVDYAVRQGLDFNCLNGTDADNALQLISLVDNALQDLEEKVRKLQGDAFQPINILTVDQEICHRYHSLLRPYRLQLADAMNRLQIENMRRVMSSLQDPAILSYVQHDNEVMSGQAELAFLQNNTTLSSPELDSSASRDRVPAPRVSRQGHGKWIASTLNFSSRQTYLTRCSASCRCACHSILAKSLPKSLCGTFTRLFPKLSGEPRLVHRCNRLDCRLRNASRTRIIVLYTTFLKWAIEASILSHGFKFKIKPRIHPVVPETSDIIRVTQMGDLDAFRNLILVTKQATIFDATDDNWTLLHNAAYQGHLEIVKLLLELGADADVTEIKLRKPSHFAKFRALRAGATKREKDVAELFHDQDFRYDFELSPIHTTVLREYDIFDLERPPLKVLLDFAVYLSNVSCKEDWSSLRLEYKNRSHLFQEMISYFEIAADGKDAGHVAFRRLLEQPDALQRWTPLQWAAFVDRKDELNTLIENGADPLKITPSRRNVLHHAAESRTSDVLEYLLYNRYHEKGIDINLHDIWGETPLHIAAEKTPASVALLLQYGAAPDVVQGEGRVPLHYVYLNKGPSRFKTVEILSNHAGCPINAQDEVGRTPIMHLLDSISCVELLLDRGADISLCDNNGRSIMHYACIEDQPEIIALLLKKCPERAQELAMHSDADGDTPLFTSLRHFRVQCAGLLLTRAPISMVTDKHGWSLLHHAVYMGDEKVVKLAVSVPNVSIFARTNDGDTALDIASKKGYIDGPIGETLNRAMGTVVEIASEMRYVDGHIGETLKSCEGSW